MYLPIRQTNCGLCEKTLDPRAPCYVLPGCCICVDCGEQPLDDIVSVLAERASVERVTGMATAIVACDHPTLIAQCLGQLAENARDFAQAMGELTPGTVEAQIDDAIGAAEAHVEGLRALRELVLEGAAADAVQGSAEGTTYHRDSGWAPTNVD